MAPPSTSSAMARAKNALSMAASVAASAMVARTVINEFLPSQVRDYIDTSLSSLLASLLSRSNTNEFTVIIDEYDGYGSNQIYEAVESYLDGKLPPSTKQVRVVKHDSCDKIAVKVDKGEVVTDVFDGVEYRWLLSSRQAPSSSSDSGNTMEDNFFELKFHRRHEDDALKTYLPHLIKRWVAVKEEERKIQLYHSSSEYWNGLTFDHPTSFDTLAMDPDLKKAVKGDLERFLRRRDYYRRVGKAWKRGYLLYGPPGTGKSSLIAAMANFLKFDVYCLELSEVTDNSTLRSLLLRTENKSILVVEDIDCSIQLRPRVEDGAEEAAEPGTKSSVTLSGVLNMIDGLVSSCGDERIIVLTTNHKEKLDPALLRPGRMDLHIHMSYCTPAGFWTLAENYHGVKEHKLFPEIERLMGEEVDVTPAEVTGELMKSEDCDEAFEILLRFLKDKCKDPKRMKKKVETEEQQSEEEGEDKQREASITEPGCKKAEENGPSNLLNGALLKDEKLDNGNLVHESEETVYIK